MKHDEPRYPTTLTFKVPRELAAEIRRVAREDDRTVSGYLRRLIVDAVKRHDATPAGR